MTRKGNPAPFGSSDLIKSVPDMISVPENGELKFG